MAPHLADPAPGAAVRLPFADRREAGRQLAARLEQLTAAEPVVVGLPRGGIPVAAEIAARLGAPLEPLVVRKLGAPDNPEYGIGAIAEGGPRVVDAEVTRLLRVRNGELDRIAAAEETELRRRVRAYRGDVPPLELRDRTVIVVDDGVATGFTDLAAIRALRRRRPRRVVLAVPVCSPEGFELLRHEADEVVALAVPRRIGSVSLAYESFEQVSDDEVIDLLHRDQRAAR